MGGKQTKLKCQPSPKNTQELQTIVSEFTSDDIKDWYKEFRGSLKDGQKELTVDEFKQVYGSVFSGDASDFAEQVFRTFDTNKSGSVDFTEFLVGLGVSGSSDCETKLNWAFRMYDINDDGFITKQEMSAILSAVCKMLGSEAGDLDVPEMTNAFFHNYDLNEDGQISWDEFRHGVTEDPTLVRLLECDPNPTDDTDNAIVDPCH